MTNPQNPALLLGQRLDELHDVIMRLREVEQHAITLRMDAAIAESKAYLAAEGSIEARKHIARIETEQAEFDARVAEANVRHLSRLMQEAKARVDAGRTFSADHRAELAVLGRDGAA